MAMVNLPGKVNLAILPHTPHGKRLAQEGFDAGKEIMLHAPMSNAGGIPLGKGGLTPDLSREEFDQTLSNDLAWVPHVRGINNHMGSELTTLPLQMGWVMQALVHRELYFVDSRTTANTVAAKTAANFSVPHLSRTVFLDNERTQQAIDHHFARLVSLAEENGLAVGIGHPYPETSAYLRQAIPQLACRGVQLALVSEVLEKETAPAAVPQENNYTPWSEPYFDAALSHVGLGLGDSVLAEMEDTGGEHRVGATLDDTVHQVVEVSDTP